jgi:Holliday junction resolvase RusA-like endonuclease
MQNKTPWRDIREPDPDAGLMRQTLSLIPTTAPISFSLPMPPSLNNLFSNGKNGGGRIKSAKYKAWIAEALFDLKKQATHKIEGRYTIDLIFPRGQTKADIWNLEKPLSDLLQHKSCRVIANDNLCDGGSIRWSDDLDAVSVTVRAA